MFPYVINQRNSDVKRSAKERKGAVDTCIVRRVMKRAKAAQRGK